MGNSGRRAGKRRRREEEEDTDTATADRLSNLPEPILCHILSFLDTKSAVQTSVLSRAWRSIWKCVPVLDLRRDRFQDASIFKRFVRKVLSHRCNVNVCKVSYVDKFAHQMLRKTDKRLFMKVIKYALSHDVQQLVVDGDSDAYFRFPSSLDSILNSNLKSLGLRYIVLDSRFGSSGFRMLTSMNLAHCMLIDNPKEELDPFSNFPCLTNLVLRDVMPICRTTRVCGSQLLRLELSDMETFEIEIFAPKLKFLCVSTPQRFSKLTLPSLDHAEITLANEALSYVARFNERVQKDFHLLFQGLHNAKSLKLDANIIQVLKTICVFLEQQPSPFRRLESLTVATDRLPYKVANYLFKGSSCEEPDIIIDLDA